MFLRVQGLFDVKLNSVKNSCYSQYPRRKNISELRGVNRSYACFLLGCILCLGSRVTKRGLRYGNCENKADE